MTAAQHISHPSKIKRIAIYCAALFVGTATCIFLVAVTFINPFLPWEYPALALVTGMTYPGGAPAKFLVLNHFLQTWLPFVFAYLTARLLTKGRARWRGALLLYVGFVVWSFAMVALYYAGMPRGAVSNIGTAGTIIGGAIGYLRLVDSVS